MLQAAVAHMGAVRKSHVSTEAGLFRRGRAEPRAPRHVAFPGALEM